MTQPGQAPDSVAHIDKRLYTARAHAAGGRDGGTARTDDGRLDVHFNLPGKPGNGTNPEQLLAAGWSTCYLSAMIGISEKRKFSLPEGTAVDIEVDLGLSHGNYALGARFNVSLPGMDRTAAQALVDEAAKVCPYSRAFHGHIDVSYDLA